MDRKVKQMQQLNASPKLGAVRGANSFPADPSLEANFTVDHVDSAHLCLGPLMQQAHEVQAALFELHARVQGMMNRVSLLSIVVLPLASQSFRAKRLQDQINKATQPAMTTLRIFDTVHKLHGTLSGGPLHDVGSYTEALFQVQQQMNFMHQSAPVAVQTLGEGVTFLRKSRLADRFQMEDLHHVVETLTALMAGQEHLSLSVNVVKQALKHLETSFQRILSDYTRPVDLHHSYLGSCEKGIVIPQKQALPSPVLQLLQRISQILAFNGKLEDCLEIHQVVRDYKLQKSLKMLDPGSYLCHQTVETIDHVEWASLEGHLAMWTQHMDIFVRLLLAPEYNLYKQIFLHSSIKSYEWKDGFARLAIQMGLNSFIGFGEAFTLSHMEPQKLFKLLDMFDCLEKLIPSFKEMFYSGGIVCNEIYMRVRSLNRGVIHRIGRVLKEIKCKIQEENNKEILGKDTDMCKGGTVLQLVSYIVNYVKCMLSDWYKPLVGRALKAEQILKDDPRESEYVAGGCEEEESELQRQQLLQTVVLEVMQALDNHLATTAQRLVEVPAYASFFLMNNYTYIYTRCLKSKVESLLGTDWLQKQLDKMELCAMQYKQEAWGQLIVLISCEGMSSSFRNLLTSGSSAGRGIIRQRAKAFQVSFDNVVARHRTWCIPNEKLRKRISHDVRRSIVPAYRNFLEKNWHFLSANVYEPSPPDQAASATSGQLDAALIKYTPESLDYVLTSTFDLAATAPFRPNDNIQPANIMRNKPSLATNDT
ncbi:hypothetical protein L7F22_045091 [Adiantum nelumboides]|nr:hypothetical protein [Adiantum nelumboides]